MPKSSSAEPIPALAPRSEPAAPLGWLLDVVAIAGIVAIVALIVSLIA